MTSYGDLVISNQGNMVWHTNTGTPPAPAVVNLVPVQQPLPPLTPSLVFNASFNFTADGAVHTFDLSTYCQNYNSNGSTTVFAITNPSANPDCSISGNTLSIQAGTSSKSYNLSITVYNQINALISPSTVANVPVNQTSLPAPPLRNYSIFDFAQYTTSTSDLPGQPMTGTLAQCEQQCDNSGSTCMGFLSIIVYCEA